MIEYNFIYIIDKRDREGSKIYWKDSKGKFHEYGSKIGKEKNTIRDKRHTKKISKPTQVSKF